MLDMDDLPETQVKHEAEEVTKLHPHLGPYTLEQSESGNWHIIWRRSYLKTFDEGYTIALMTSCDRNWLAICKKYGIFALFTHDSLQATMKQKERTFFTERGHFDPITPKLIITPNSNQELKRLLALCESINDPTWKYKWLFLRHPPEVLIECVDTWQAQRRITFLKDKVGLRFTHKVE
jgi:hypothetical protein